MDEQNELAIENRRLRKRLAQLESAVNNGHTTGIDDAAWEAKWRSLAETAADHVIILDRQKVIRYINHVVPPLTRDEVIGVSAYEFMLPEHHDRMRQCYDEVLADGRLRTLECEGVGAHGQRAWYRARVGPVWEQGEIVGLTLFVVDISEARQVEQRLRESEQLHRTLLEKHVDGVALVIDGKISYVNPAALRMTGYNDAELIGLDPAELVRAEDRQRVKTRILELFAGAEEAAGEYTALRRDGSTFPMEVRSRLIQLSGRPVLLSFLRDVARRKENEARLRDNEHRWRSILDALPDLVLVLDARGTYRHLFTAQPELLVEPPGGLLGRTLHEVIPPELAERMQRVIDRAIESAQVQQLEYQLTIRGKAKWFATRVVPFGAHEDPCVLWVARDVSSERQFQDALQESESRFRQLASSIDEVFWLSTPDKSQMLYVSPAYETVFGRSCESLYASPRSFLDAIHPEDRRRVTSQLPMQAEGGFDEEFRIVRGDGSQRWIRSRAFPVKDESGHIYRIAGLTEDITHQKAFEHLLEHWREKWQSLAIMSADFVVVADCQGTITFVNRAVEGLHVNDIIGSSIHQWVLPQFRQAQSEVVQSVLATGEVSSFECQGTGPHGQTRWYSVRVGPFRPHGKNEGITLYITDITHRKEYDEKLKAEERLLRRLLNLQEKERKLVAHDIHDGLVQDAYAAQLRIEGIKHRLSHDQRNAEQLAEACRRLQAAISEARRLISQLRPMILDEDGIVEAVRYLISDQRFFGSLDVGLTVDVQFDRLDPMLEGAVFRIVQEALTNVLWHGQSQTAQVKLLQEDDQLYIEITDQGIGFDQAAVPKDRFGLRGIKERARLFGGEAEIESEVGQGTRITARIPLVLPA